ncbi:methylcrotonoyl-CoA carboxylase subunit alpha, mitochondrial-like isoform X2 [Actinidia eriantha]|uniref:methylcrotonoyl-CoA carboxylase subunit alpha, mitochondrial-like isoform X2 n=1 Tax=Actinidia eriantha TaxID=165200 RepID=UPI002587EEF3|nr:methylcrotonoyl-CoA carboxylase subunit alpha, mitochondrial-like isoform X2 [Actinidia eriantha]
MKSSNIQSIVAKILFEVVPASTHNIRLDKSFSCHAFEDRTYAENVPKGFLLATEVFHHYHPVPISATAVRVETEVEQGDTVSMQYDPMIAKLVVWGENRAAALVKLKDCLCQSSCNPVLAQKAHNAAKVSKYLVAACICEKENGALRERPPGGSRYGMLIPLSESIIMLGVQWNLSGSMNIVVVVQSP